MYGRHGRGLQRLVATLLLAQQSLACAGWRAQKLTPEQVIQEKQPNNVLVTTLQDSKIELREPIALVGDRLTGVIARGRYRGAVLEVPLDSVRTVAVRKISPARTGIFLVGVVATVFVVIGALQWQDAISGL
jgi:hypothetical protein